MVTNYPFSPRTRSNLTLSENASLRPTITRHHMNKAPYFRVRFADGYIFRIAARDVGDLRHRAATHYWWGDEKPPVDQVTLTLQRHRRKAGLVHYDAKAPGFPKLVVG